MANLGLKGLEPLRLAAQDPKSCVSANSTTDPWEDWSTLFCSGQQLFSGGVGIKSFGTGEQACYDIFVL